MLSLLFSIVVLGFMRLTSVASVSAVCRRYNVSPYITTVQIIFHFLWDHWAHCGIFENEVLLMYALVGENSVANFITAYEDFQ